MKRFGKQLSVVPAVLLLAIACSDSTAPRVSDCLRYITPTSLCSEPGFQLVSVDSDPLPAPHRLTLTFEDGAVYTSVLAARIILRADSSYLTAVTLRDSSETRGRQAPYPANFEGRYVLRNGSLAVCARCTSDLSEGADYYQVPYSDSGFTLPLLFSTGRFGAYHYKRR